MKKYNITQRIGTHYTVKITQIPTILWLQPNTHKVQTPHRLIRLGSPASIYLTNINITLHHMSLSTLQSKFENLHT
jgi:hypothetical protein